MAFVICVPWGKHGVPSQQRECVCGVSVALSDDNAVHADALELQAICLVCAMEFVAEDTARIGGGLLGGRVVPLKEFVPLMVAAMSRN